MKPKTTTTNNNNNKKKISAYMAFTFAALLFIYFISFIYFLPSSVAVVVERSSTRTRYFSSFGTYSVHPTAERNAC